MDLERQGERVVLCPRSDHRADPHQSLVFVPPISTPISTPISIQSQCNLNAHLKLDRSLCGLLEIGGLYMKFFKFVLQ